MAAPRIDDLPGFRRRILITPEPGRVTTALEDDYHCMSVVIHHKDGIATAIEPVMHRWPWNTCPGAVEQLKQTFTGVPLAEFMARGEARANCTHLHDLAVWGANHAHDDRQTVFDVLVSDLVEGRTHSELRRDGAVVLHWISSNMQLEEPSELAGLKLTGLRDWMATLDAKHLEEARILRWATMMSHGRTMEMKPGREPLQASVGNCYTFQPGRIEVARHTGNIRDFSISGSKQPLEEYRRALQVADNPGMPR
jgi:hypothetical protein